MTTKKPATALPWRTQLNRTSGYVMSNSFCVAALGDGTVPRDANAAYIVHAANAYPQLVEELKKAEAALRIAETLIVRGGGNEPNRDVSGQIDDCVTLLSELGEAQ